MWRDKKLAYPFVNLIITLLVVIMSSFTALFCQANQASQPYAPLPMPNPAFISPQAQPMPTGPQGHNTSLYAPALQHILTKGVLTIAIVGQDTPPFFMTAQMGGITGIDSLIAQSLAKEIGVPVQFNRTAQTFDQVVDLVAAGIADIGISKISYTFERSKKALYTAPYVHLNQAVLLNRTLTLQYRMDSAVKTLQELLNNKKSKIGVVGGTSYETYAKKAFPEATVVPYATWEDVISAVAEGDILAAFRDDLEIKKILIGHEDALRLFIPMVIPQRLDPIQMVVSYQNAHMRDIINAYLTARNEDTTADDLLRQFRPYIPVTSFNMPQAETPQTPQPELQPQPQAQATPQIQSTAQPSGSQY